MASEQPKGFDAMSAYEKSVWSTAVARLNKSETSALRGATSRVTGPVARVSSKVWNKVPLHDGLEEQLEKALEGLVSATLQPAMNTVNRERVADRVGVPWNEFHTLDLERLDKASPRSRGIYTAAALAEGSATSLAVTGATVATTVSGGTTAAVAVGAVAVDVAASIGLLGRITAVAAAEYGYDVRLPEEEMFALGAISVGSAGSPATKVAALSSLSRLTQQMMRRATWTQLNKNSLVKVVDIVFKSLGLRLTHQKLGQAIPVLGIAINGGLSAQMADQTYRRARDIYRLRFLSDKYGIDPAAWVANAEHTEADEVLGAALDELDLPAGDEPDEENRSESS